MQKLTFKISDVPVFIFEVDHVNKRVTLLNEPDEIGADILLTENERNYNGIEKRLNYLMNKEHSLEEWAKIINKGDFYADSQHRLNLSVENSEHGEKYPPCES